MLKSGYSVCREARVYRGTVCPPEEDMARQEYALSSQIQYQIQQFGVGRPAESGEVDWDLRDLTTAMSIVREANDQWLTIPADVRARYSSWSNLEHARASGELDAFLKTRGAAPVAGAAVAGRASESAPVEGGKA